MLPRGDTGNTSFCDEFSANEVGISVVEYERQGRVFKQHVTGRKSERIGGGKRSEVTEFTASSRKRLMEKLNRLDKKALCNAEEQPKFLTLTYGQVFPSPEVSKRQLRAFFERVRRRWPDATGFWRLEFQKRGAPHFHLILFGLPYLPFTVLRQWWEEIIGWDRGREVTEHVFVNIKRIQSWRQLSAYVSKYLAKPEKGTPTAAARGESSSRVPRRTVGASAEASAEALDGPQEADQGESSSLLDTDTYLHVGRWWGVFNRACLPLAELVMELFFFGMYVWKVREAAMKFYDRLSRWSAGFTLFLDEEEMKYFWAYALDVAEGGA